MSDASPIIEPFDPEELGPLTVEQVKWLAEYIKNNPDAIKPGFMFADEHLNNKVILFDKEKKAIVIDDKPLARGQSGGTVFLGKYVNFDRPGKALMNVAIKVQDKESTAVREMELTERSKGALQNIATEDKVFILMRLEKVSLQDVIAPDLEHERDPELVRQVPHISLSKKDKVNIAIDLLKDLHLRIHDPGLIHRDIKLRNIMLDPVTKKAKIIDPGEAVDLEREKKVGAETQISLQMDATAIEKIEYFKKAPYHLNLKAVTHEVFISDTGQEFYIPNKMSEIRGALAVQGPEIIGDRSAEHEPLFQLYSTKSDIYAMSKVFDALGLDFDKDLERLIADMRNADPVKRPSAEEALAKLYQYRNKEWHDEIVPPSLERLNRIKKELQVFVIPSQQEPASFSMPKSAKESGTEVPLMQRKAIPKGIQDAYAKLIRLEREFRGLNREHRQDPDIINKFAELKKAFMDSNPALKEAITAEALILAEYLQNFESNFEKSVIAGNKTDFLKTPGRDFFVKQQFKEDIEKIGQALAPIINKLKQGGKDLTESELDNLDSMIKNLQNNKKLSNNPEAQKYLTQFRTEMLAEIKRDILITPVPSKYKP